MIWLNVFLTFVIPSLQSLKNLSLLYEDIKSNKSDPEYYFIFLGDQLKIAQAKFLNHNRKYYSDTHFFENFDTIDKILLEIEKLFDEEFITFKSKFPLTKNICGFELRRLEFDENKYETIV